MIYNPDRDFFTAHLKVERVRWPINLVEKFQRKQRNIYDFDSIFRLVIFFPFFFFKGDDCLSQTFHRKFPEEGVKRKETKE